MRKWTPIVAEYNYKLRSLHNLLFRYTLPDRKYHVTQPCNTELNHQTLLHRLQHCSNLQSLDATKSLHALTITIGSNSSQSIFLNNKIMSLYGSMGCVWNARKMFDEMPERNIVSFNTMIGCYSRNGFVEEAWIVFSEMRSFGFVPTQFTFGALLSCGSLEVRRKSYLQGLIIKSGLFYADAFAGTALLGCFGRNGCLDKALWVFEDMPHRNLVTWNCLISLFGNHGFGDECIFMFRELMRSQLLLSQYSFVGVLSGFVREEDLDSGEQIHGLVIKIGFCVEVSIANALVNMYENCSGTCTAEMLFKEMRVRDIVSWNTIIGILAKSDRPGKALECFWQMNQDGFLPNKITFIGVINACTILEIPHHGKSIHALLIKKRLESDVFTGSSLVDFYAKCGQLEDAHRSFDEIQEKNVVSWNSLILGYSNRSCSTSVYLLGQMIGLGYRPNERSFSAVIRVSFNLELQQLHAFVIKMGYLQNEYVLSSLIGSYAKNGLIDDALSFVANMHITLPVVPSNVIAGIFNRTGQYHQSQKLYSVLDEPDTVSWNILIAACSRNGNYKEVFELFSQMQIDEVCPDKYTYVSLLSVCTRLRNLNLGKSLHSHIIKTNFRSCDTFVCNILIDMYGKCGSLDSSIKIFSEMKDKNVISWTAVTSSLGLHGRAHEAVQKFREMEMMGFLPDRVAFLAVLSACGHKGLVKEGMELFEQMKSKYKVEPEMDHYILVVDLLARYGYLKKAEQLIIEMPFPPNALIWHRFLEGCKRQRYAEDLALSKQTGKSGRITISYLL